MNKVKIFAIGMVVITGWSCCGTNSNQSNQSKNCCMNQKKYEKKYTNADFYTDGQFNEEVVFKAPLFPNGLPIMMAQDCALPTRRQKCEALWKNQSL